MTQVEVDVGMSGNHGLAVFTIFEHGRFRDAILLLQSLTQQQIGCCTRLAPQFITKLQSLFTALC